MKKDKDSDKPAELSNEDLVKIVLAHRKHSFGPSSSEVTADRADAMDRYHGRPYGDEKRGRS